LIQLKRTPPDLQLALGASVGLWSFGYAVDAVIRLSAGNVPPVSHLWLLVAHSAVSFLTYPAVILSERLSRWPRWALLAVACFALTYAQVVAEFARELLLQQPEAIKAFKSALRSQPFMIFLYVMALNIFLVVLVRTQRRAEEQRRRLLAAELSAQQAQLTVLRLQINPHFLFNTLNTISGLMVTGRIAEAEQMMARLADFLRTSLTNDPTADVTVDDELAAAEAYLQIETARIGERMQLEIACAREVRRALVPNLILQPLVENAVKYGVAPASGAVSLRLRAWREEDELVLEVADQPETAGDVAPAPSGTGLGLGNVRRRLEVLYGERGRLIVGRRGGGWAAAVRLPLRFASAGVPAEPALPAGVPVGA
jgi:hypothetical protein